MQEGWLNNTPKPKSKIEVSRKISTVKYAESITLEANFCAQNSTYSKLTTKFLKKFI
jgi:hypothetical protein